MEANPKTRFFDDIADRWDGWEDLDLLAEKLAGGLDDVGVTPCEVVLDVGCGTGNLTQALLRKLGANGRVVAVDFSPAMVAKAKEKVADPRVQYVVADATQLPLPDGSVDRAICFSVWPHFDDPNAISKELGRVLRDGGRLHIWHLASRETINEIHTSAGGPIANDLLPPATAIARLLEDHGLSPYEVVEDDSRYLVSASNVRAGRASRLEKIRRRVERSPSMHISLTNLGLDAVPRWVFDHDLLTLDLSGNALTTLPEDIELLWSLELLDIRRNALERLPESIRALGRLQELYADENELRSLPDWLGELPELRYVQVYGNPFAQLEKSELTERFPKLRIEL